jgi:hypothetical protein
VLSLAGAVINGPEGASTAVGNKRRAFAVFLPKGLFNAAKGSGCF